MKEIQKLRELLERATPGPWFAGGLVGDDFQTISIGDLDVSDKPSPAHYEDTICDVWDNPNLAEDAINNASLIVEAVNTLPWLLDEIEDLEAHLERARDQIADLRDTIDVLQADD